MNPSSDVDDIVTNLAYSPMRFSISDKNNIEFNNCENNIKFNIVFTNLC